MLDTAFRQLRHGWSVATGRRIQVADVLALVASLRATAAEFGHLDRQKMLEAVGAAADPELRRLMDERRWNASVRKAYHETVYYREVLDRLRLAPRDLTLDRIAELPPSPKSALRALPEAFVSARADPALQAFTTGSTGIPASCWFSAYELDLAAAAGAVSLLVNVGIDVQDTVAICTSSRAVLAGHTFARSLRLAGAATAVCGVIDPAETLSRLATPVHLPGRKPKASVLACFPSYLALLIQTAERLGYTGADFELERLLIGGEVLSDPLRRRAEEFFGAEIFDCYSMTEVFPLGGLVCSRGHLHFAADQGLVEVLDPVTFAPARPGQVGTLVVTPFPPYRETTLLLRFATGDLVRRLTDEPTCELAGLPATSPLLGKASLSSRAAERPLYQRDILDLLEAQPELPAPVRYGVEAADDGFDLHVHGPEHPGLQAALERGAGASDLPIRKIVLHQSADDVPRPSFARAMLRETVVVPDEQGATWTLR